MKHKKSNKKILSPIFSGIILAILLISASLFYRHQQQNKPFTIDSLDLSDWTQNENPSGFIFPKDNIFIFKNFQNSYHLKNNFLTKSNFDIFSPINMNQKDIETKLNSFNEIKKITTKLNRLNFIKDENLSGVYHVSDSGSRYLITYTKGSTFCQIKAIFDCYKNFCYSSNTSIGFGCGSFDLEKEFQTQSQYYKENIYHYYEGKPYTSYIYVVKTNPKYKLILQDLITDVGVSYINNQGKEVCGGKGCCDTSSKNDPEFWGDWCTDDYQTVDTYQPVGL